jgi:hypothetical protein
LFSPGRVAALDTLAKQFMAADGAGKAALLADAETTAAGVAEADVVSTKFYLLTMKRVCAFVCVFIFFLHLFLVLLRMSQCRPETNIFQKITSLLVPAWTLNPFWPKIFLTSSPVQMAG